MTYNCDTFQLVFKNNFWQTCVTAVDLSTQLAGIVRLTRLWRS